MQVDDGIKDATLDSMALRIAKEIEDIFAQSWDGGRTQRLAEIQCRIRDSYDRLKVTVSLKSQFEM